MARIPGFKGEYLWELDIADHHLAASAEAIPADRYDWRPAGDARSVSEVLVHIAAGNFALLNMVGVPLPPEWYPALAEQGVDRFFALIMRNRALEQAVTAKPDMIAMLRQSLAAVRDAFTQASLEDLDRPGTFFGEQTTVRRVYQRILAHTHEHMGQMIAYVRTMGLKAPWEDPFEQVRAHVAGSRQG